MAKAESPYTFRPYKPEDIPFIHSSWEQSYKSYGRDPRFRGSVKEFYQKHRKIRDRLLSNKNVAVIVCCSNEDLILGWIMIEKSENRIGMHYIYVKEALRDQHIARDLTDILKSDNVLYSHLTKQAKAIIKDHPDKFKNWIYLPLDEIRNINKET